MLHSNSVKNTTTDAFVVLLQQAVLVETWISYRIEGTVNVSTMPHYNQKDTDGKVY